MAAKNNSVFSVLAMIGFKDQIMYHAINCDQQLNVIFLHDWALNAWIWNHIITY